MQLWYKSGYKRTGFDMRCLAGFLDTSLHVDMVLSGHDFYAATGDCSKRRMLQLFAANGGEEVLACDRDIRYG